MDGRTLHTPPTPSCAFSYILKTMGGKNHRIGGVEDEERM